ncbi:hypothetical protein VSVS12_02729 [Vibrio scophthalmi]|uniref:hypothetical protein n=1 Tax=Vibrio scophthalmi TaxID=45658 RepID=UPI0008091832|nr:hypothetical protein [Vibrio scophthalmi]ANS86478.1 hypothetical protein VSVS12_02729 [Vibrio scophthalmi]
MEQLPVDQVTALFDISSLITFFIAAAGSLIAFKLGYIAYLLVRAMLREVDYEDDDDSYSYKPKNKKRYYKKKRYNNYKNYNNYNKKRNNYRKK